MTNSTVSIPSTAPMSIKDNKRPASKTPSDSGKPPPKIKKSNTGNSNTSIPQMVDSPTQMSSFAKNDLAGLRHIGSGFYNVQHGQQAKDGEESTIDLEESVPNSQATIPTNPISETGMQKIRKKLAEEAKREQLGKDYVRIHGGVDDFGKIVKRDAEFAAKARQDMLDVKADTFQQWTAKSSKARSQISEDDFRNLQEKPKTPPNWDNEEPSELAGPQTEEEQAEELYTLKRAESIGFWNDREIKKYGVPKPPTLDDLRNIANQQGRKLTIVIMDEYDKWDNLREAAMEKVDGSPPKE